jgi:hypothetical protein
MDLSQSKCPGCKRPMTISKVKCSDCNVVLDGEFEVSPLARLSLEDQLMVTAFVRHHGSIKKMERLFGISYPTVKNRLNAISKQLDHNFQAPSTNLGVLDKLSRGEISVTQALEELD